jgi:hypothetical protein
VAKRSNQFFNLDRILLLLGGLFTVFMFILLIAFFVGGPLEGLLRGLGLEIKEFRGIFIDCSKPANKNHTFCEELKKRREPVQVPQDLYHRDAKSLPFNLSN